MCQEEFTSICQLVEARGIITMKQGKNMRLTKVGKKFKFAMKNIRITFKTIFVEDYV